jgi:hypothetical protein
MFSLHSQAVSQSFSQSINQSVDARLRKLVKCYIVRSGKREHLIRSILQFSHLRGAIPTKHNRFHSSFVEKEDPKSNPRLKTLRSHLHHNLRPLQHPRILIRHLQESRRDHNHPRRTSTPSTILLLWWRRCSPLVRKRRRLGEDQDAHFSRRLEDVGDVLAAGAVAVGGAGPGGEGVGEGGGGGGDVGVAVGEVGLVGFGRGAEVGA